MIYSSLNQESNVLARVKSAIAFYFYFWFFK